MNNPQYILLPANSFFIYFSLFVAFVLNILPWGSLAGVPDILALTIIFWSFHQPRKVGVGVAFMMGLLLDVHEAVYLGENALSYTLLSFFAITIHRRVLWFPVSIQSIHVFPLLLGMQLVELLTRLWVDPNAHFIGWVYFLESATTTILWPLATFILLAPQRRVVDKDFTRPI